MSDSGLAILTATLGGLCLRFILHHLVLGDAVDTAFVGFWEGLIFSSNTVTSSSRRGYGGSATFATFSLGLQLLLDAFIWRSATRLVLISLWACLGYLCVELISETVEEKPSTSKGFASDGSKDRRPDDRSPRERDRGYHSSRRSRRSDPVSPTEQLTPHEENFFPEDVAVAEIDEGHDSPLGSLRRELQSSLHHRSASAQARSPVPSRERTTPPRPPLTMLTARSDTTEGEAADGTPGDWPSTAKALNLPVIMPSPQLRAKRDTKRRDSFGRSETSEEEPGDERARAWKNALPPISSPTLDPASAEVGNPHDGETIEHLGINSRFDVDDRPPSFVPLEGEASTYPQHDLNDDPLSPTNPLLLPPEQSHVDELDKEYAHGSVSDAEPANENHISDVEYQSDPTIPESAITPGPALTIVGAADALRDEASRLLRERERLLAEREVALREGRTRDAFQLKMQANDAGAQALKCNQRAERRYIYANNRFRNRGRQLDVHGLKPEEATRRVDAALFNVVQRGQNHLSIIVGPSQHSDGPVGPPVLRPVLLNHFKREGLSAHVDPSNSGVLIVKI